MQLTQITIDEIKRMNYDELEKLASSYRRVLVDVVTKNGGHLASNLGVVELTLAIHRIFNSPVDKIIWDVGHQAYVHKLITGRVDMFQTLRKTNGLSGFPKRNESEHDVFNTGHSSTSLSAALGMAISRDLKGEDYDVIAVVGDGALTGGMALEALNDIGVRKTRLLILLNDNEMSISKNVGAMSLRLSKLRTGKRYIKLKRDISHRHPKLKTFLERVKNSVKYFFIPS